MANVIDSQASKFLGKNTTNYDLSYNPDLLNPIERIHNRKDYGISSEDFKGADVWHNYECNFLLDNGFPVNFVGKLIVPSWSEYFIESKSMKLYFFSLQSKKFGSTFSDAMRNFEELVKNDISSKIGAPVEFKLFNYQCNTGPIGRLFTDITEYFDFEKLTFDNYKESPDLLENDGAGTISCVFKGFRSNCRVTHQPDFANTLIYMCGTSVPTKESLARYLVSFRNEFHFHEEVTEQIFTALNRKFKPQKILVVNLFTRRGGLDICPVRYKNIDFEAFILDPVVLTNPTIYQ